MTIPVRDRLYNLLPALYRLRDQEPAQAEALRALMALIEQQFLLLEADVDQLYDDAFIETCQEWLVPYIGDLLGVRPLQDIPTAAPQQLTSAQTAPYSRRAYVANTLAYRQRKGTATVLEQLARDLTNWPARAVEYFQRLEWTQHLNHVRPNSWRTPDLRDTNALALLNTPFEIAQHTPDIRHIDHPIDSEQGRYNISHIGIGLWRLQSYPLAQVEARPVPGQPGLYWINPLGQDLPLFNTPEPETSITTLAREINVPAPLRRRPLHDEVEAIAAAQLSNRQYFSGQPAFQLYLPNAEGEPEAVLPEELLICDLSGEPGTPNTNWQRLNATRHVRNRPDARRIAVDPVLGRLAILQGKPIPETVLVSYAYGFSGDIGGGPYDRRASVAQALSQPVTWQIGVSRFAVGVGEEAIVTSLSEAIAQWNAQPPGTLGAIVLMDNRSYQMPATAIALPAGSELLVLAADWPRIALSPPELGEIRRLNQWVPIGHRAHLLGDISVVGTAEAERPNSGRLTLDGLLIEGRLTVQAGNLEHLRLAHCSLVPSQGGLVGESSASDGDNTNSRLTVEIERSITGPIYLPQTIDRLIVQDSIVDATQAGRIWMTPPLSFPLPAGEFLVRQADGSEHTLSVPTDADIETVQADLEVALQTLPGIEGMRVGQLDEPAGDRLILFSLVPLTFGPTESDIETVARLGLLDTAVAIASSNPNQAGPKTTLSRTTVFGGSYVQTLSASEVIWTGRAIAQRRQTGCVRFSYLPSGSRTPRRYRCQPELAIETQLETATRQKGSPLSAAETATIRSRLQRQIVPSFTTRRYGQPAYGQLSRTCPSQIRSGAEDGSEMGAFSFLKQPQREANLRTALDEYLRFGLEAGIFYLT